MRNYIATIGFIFIVIVIGNVTIVAQNQRDMNIGPEIQKAVVTQLVKDLDESYVFPDVAKKLDKHLKSRLSDYSSITSARKFAEALTKDLQSVNDDKHLRVRFSYDRLPDRKERTSPSREEEERYFAFMKRVNYGFDSVKRLPGNVGYIELRGFMNEKLGENTVAAAMNFVSNTEALIIDLRRNGGGSPKMVALICSYFFGDEKVHLNDLYWRKGNRTDEFWTQPKVKGTKYLEKDVYILTSNRTFSGAEEFSYNLRNLNRAIIIGETTGGGAHPGGSFRLHDHFSAFISTGRAISPITKTNWEGTGVEPHFKVKKDIALETAQLKALEKIHASTDDPNLKRSILNQIEGLKKKINKFGEKKAD
ncbi:MAG: S41 family peptidase [Pyrinomonadaceae bacterium]|nr:S41 family peptidase [Pyrinomonadaceae bacterium]